MAATAMVTGASSGIGMAYAERLAADGWNLIVVARRADRLGELAARLAGAHGVQVAPLEADLSRAEEVERVCERIAATPLELLVNNAGLAHYRPFAELDPGAARELVDLNALAPVLLSRAAVAGMVERRRGAIVNVASLLAFSAAAEAPHLPRRAIYAATKSFLVTFSRILAAEVRERGVRVQVVCPGVVRSEFHTRQGMDMSAVERMEPGDVVRASLADLEAGVLVSVPGLADTTAVERLDAASLELVAAARTAALPDRYGDG